MTNATDRTIVEIRHLKRRPLDDLIPFSHQLGNLQFRVDGEVMQAAQKHEILERWTSAMMQARLDKLEQIRGHEGSEEVSLANRLSIIVEKDRDNLQKLRDATTQVQHAQHICELWWPKFQDIVQKDQGECLRRATELRLSLDTTTEFDPMVSSATRSKSESHRRRELEHLESDIIPGNAWRLIIYHDLFRHADDAPAAANIDATHALKRPATFSSALISNKRARTLQAPMSLADPSTQATPSTTSPQQPAIQQSLLVRLKIPPATQPSLIVRLKLHPGFSTSPAKSTLPGLRAPSHSQLNRSFLRKLPKLPQRKPVQDCNSAPVRASSSNGNIILPTIPSTPPINRAPAPSAPIDSTPASTRAFNNDLSPLQLLADAAVQQRMQLASSSTEVARSEGAVRPRPTVEPMTPPLREPTQSAKPHGSQNTTAGSKDAGTPAPSDHTSSPMNFDPAFLRLLG